MQRRVRLEEEEEKNSEDRHCPVRGYQRREQIPPTIQPQNGGNNSALAGSQFGSARTDSTSTTQKLATTTTTAAMKKNLPIIDTNKKKRIMISEDLSQILHFISNKNDDMAGGNLRRMKEAKNGIEAKRGFKGVCEGGWSTHTHTGRKRARN